MSRLRISRRVIARMVAWGAMTLGVLNATAVWAQTPQNDFVPMSAAAATQQEALPASPLVYAAYGFVWIALVVYVFLLWQRIGKVERELAEVSSRLAARR